MTIAIRRAVAVTPSVPFLAREIAGKQGRVAQYTLRQSGAVVNVRHRTFDIEIFQELHLSQAYEPPPSAAAALASVAHPLRIVDLGGYTGSFGAWALNRFPNATLNSVEADPANFRLLRATRSANGLESRWQVEEAFASTAPSEVVFASTGDAMSHAVDQASSAPGTVTVPAVDVLPALANADFAKIDIEGAEWPILQDPRLADSGLRAITLEFHPREDGRSEETVLDALHGAGFSAEITSRFNVPGLGHVWGWR